MMTPLLFAARIGMSVAAAAAAAVPAASLPPLPHQAPGQAMATLPLDHVVPGSHGVCYTVFEGYAVEPFAFVVKSVMPKFLGPDDDLLLVRLVGEKPEFTGVVSGMSGSPCYIDNKLVGALSYSFATFAKEPIAGITAIAAMNRSQDGGPEPRPYRRAVAQRMAPWPQSGPSGGGARGADAASAALLAPMEGAAEGMLATPIATPLGLGNMVPEVRAFFAPYLKEMGFVPLATGVMGRSDDAPKTLEPGGSIAVIIAQGDINMAATGTVTTVHDGRVLAFGHPFTGGGPVSFPMATSRVVNTMASSSHSFKMAVAGPVVGEIHDDRLPAIAGTLGPAPAMVPVRGTLTTSQGRHAFEFDVARDPLMTPRVVAMGTLNALTSRTQASGAGTGRITATLTVQGHEPVVRTFVEAHPQGGMLFTQPALKLYETFSTLWDTDFEPPGNVAIALSADLAPAAVGEVVQDISFDRSFVQSGANLRMAVHLKGLTGQVRRETFKLPIPVRWRGEQLQVVAVGGGDAVRFLKELQGAPNPQNYADVLAELRQRPQEGELYVFVLKPGTTLHRGGRSFGNVPPSALALLGQAPGDQVVPHNIDFRSQRHAPGAVEGLVRRSFSVSPKAQSDRLPKAAHN